MGSTAKLVSDSEDERAWCSHTYGKLYMEMRKLGGGEVAFPDWLLEWKNDNWQVRECYAKLS